MTGLTEDSFRPDRLAQYAIVRRLEILEEAATELPAAVRAQHPELPWDSIIGLRQRLIPDSLHADLDAVWMTIQSCSSSRSFTARGDTAAPGATFQFRDV